MKFLYSVLFCLLSAASQTAQGQQPAASQLPSISYQQMLSEHDTLVSYIRQSSPVIYYNKQVRGIDFDSHARRIRKMIGPRTSMGEYLQLVKKTLNAAQDGHTSQVNSTLLDIVVKHWIPAKLVDFDSASTANMYRYASYLKEAYYSKAELNLIYTNGSYYNLLPFSYKGRDYPANMQLLRCNGKDIHAFVKKMTLLVSPLRWDRSRNRVYDENFYWPSDIYRNGKLDLVFIDKSGLLHPLQLGSRDTVSYAVKKTHDYGYFGQTDTVVTHFFPEQGIFYAKLPAMREELGDTIRRRMALEFSRNKVKSVVVDIRGNGGGSDRTYGKFLSALVSDTLKMNVVVARNFSPLMQRHYRINRDSVLKSSTMSFESGGPELSSPGMYYIKQNFSFVVPDSARLPFEGKIYVLQDKFIYSSASNLSNLAKGSSQLVSVGETPDLLGGLQASTIMFMLPYSKFIFRVEPQIDLTSIGSVADIFHNHVEQAVPYGISDLYLRSTTSGDIYGKEFLLRHDPMFGRVVELEKGR